MNEKTYEISETIINQIIQLINSLPYGQVARLANDLGQIVAAQKNTTEE